MPRTNQNQENILAVVYVLLLLFMLSIKANQEVCEYSVQSEVGTLHANKEKIYGH